jgi:signal transduction histidine kinase
MQEATGEERPTDARTLRRLHDATREMVAAESREAVYRTATDAAAELLGFRYCTVREYDAERDALVPAAATPDLVRHAGERRAYARGESVQWNAIETGEILVFPDVAAVDDGADREGEGSMLVVPLGDHGVLTLGSPRPRDVDEGDVELARVLGANLETAIERVDQVRTLRERQRALRRKTDRLDRFAGLVAHEFRNPLGIAAGHLDLVVGTGDDQSHLSAARDAVGRMNRLTESLLDLVHDDTLTGGVETVRVDDLARAVFGEACPATATLSATAPVRVEANRERLRTVLENLFENAAAYGGAAVHVWVGPLSDEGFYVADDGPGFDADRPEDPFAYRASSGGRGVGLGLAIVRDVAAAHGWRVSVRDSRAGGVRVEFATAAEASLPAATDRPVEAGTTRADPP